MAERPKRKSVQSLMELLQTEDFSKKMNSMFGKVL